LRSQFSSNNYRLFTREKAVDFARVEMTTNYLSAIRLRQELEPMLGDKPEAAFIIITSDIALVPDVTNPRTVQRRPHFIPQSKDSG
jgi:uncharacterized oxidoreductase